MNQGSKIKIQILYIILYTAFIYNIIYNIQKGQKQSILECPISQDR